MSPEEKILKAELSPLEQYRVTHRLDTKLAYYGNVGKPQKNRQSAQHFTEAEELAVSLRELSASQEATFYLAQAVIMLDRARNNEKQVYSEPLNHYLVLREEQPPTLFSRFRNHLKQAKSAASTFLYKQNRAHRSELPMSTTDEAITNCLRGIRVTQNEAQLNLFLEMLVEAEVLRLLAQGSDQLWEIKTFCQDNVKYYFSQTESGLTPAKKTNFARKLAILMNDAHQLKKIREYLTDDHLPPTYKHELLHQTVDLMNEMFADKNFFKQNPSLKHKPATKKDSLAPHPAERKNTPIQVEYVLKAVNSVGYELRLFVVPAKKKVLAKQLPIVSIFTDGLGTYTIKQLNSQNDFDSLTIGPKHLEGDLEVPADFSHFVSNIETLYYHWKKLAPPANQNHSGD